MSVMMPGDLPPIARISLETPTSQVLNPLVANTGKLWAKVVEVTGNQVILAVSEASTQGAQLQGTVLRLAAQTQVPLAKGDVVSLQLTAAEGGQLSLRITGKLEAGAVAENASLPQVVLRIPAGLQTPPPGQVVTGQVLESTGGSGVMHIFGQDLPVKSDASMTAGETLPMVWEGAIGGRGALRILPQAQSPLQTHLAEALSKSNLTPNNENIGLAKALVQAGLPVQGQEVTWLKGVVPGGAGEKAQEVATLKAQNPNIAPDTLAGIAKTVLARDLGGTLAKIPGGEQLVYNPGTGGAAALETTVSTLYGPKAGQILSQDAAGVKELGTNLLYHQLLSGAGNVAVGIPVTWGNNQPGTVELRAEREAPGRKVNPQRTIVTLAMDTPNLGSLKINIAMVNGNMGVNLVVTEDGSRRFLTSKTGLLQKGLEKLSYRVRGISVSAAASGGGEEKKSIDRRI